MMATAIRRLELSLLTVDDLDWDTEEVRVVNGKGQKQRTSPFPTQVQLPMLRYLAHRRHRFPDAEPWLWLTEEGKRLSYNGIYQDLDRLARRAGIRDSIQDLCHIFRRTAGAIAEREGVPRLYTMEKLGWSSSAMLEHYAADMRTEDAEAIQAFKDKDPLGKWFEKGRKKRMMSINCTTLEKPVALRSPHSLVLDIGRATGPMLSCLVYPPLELSAPASKYLSNS